MAVLKTERFNLELKYGDSQVSVNFSAEEYSGKFSIYCEPQKFKKFANILNYLYCTLVRGEAELNEAYEDADIKFLSDGSGFFYITGAYNDYGNWELSFSESCDQTYLKNFVKTLKEEADGIEIPREFKRKICVVGNSGSGKSTLARVLGEKYSLPVLHLDNTFWYGNWQHRSREEQAAIVKRFLDCFSDGWVIDGNYFKICPCRAALSDEIYYLNYNRFFCYKEARKRYKKYKGQVRPDCDSPEKFDFEFAKWILFDGVTKKRKEALKSFIDGCRGKVHSFKNRKKLNEFLKK